MDLCLGLLEGGGGSKGFGYRLAIDGAGETDLRVVAGIVGFSAVAGGLATSTNDGGDGAWSQITKCADLAQDMGALSLEVFTRNQARAGLLPVCYTTLRNITTKKETERILRKVILSS